jgi:hypothetical protein
MMRREGGRERAGGKKDGGSPSPPPLRTDKGVGPYSGRPTPRPDRPADIPAEIIPHTTSLNTNGVKGRIFCVGDRYKGVKHLSWSTTVAARQ